MIPRTFSSALDTLHLSVSIFIPSLPCSVLQDPASLGCTLWDLDFDFWLGSASEELDTGRRGVWSRLSVPCSALLAAILQWV